MNKIEEVVQLGYYKHYKGTVYFVTGLVRHSEDLSVLVEYKVEGEDPWVRPIESFMSSVAIYSDNDKEVKVVGYVPRFKFLGKTKNIL